MKIYGDSISGNCLKVKWVADSLGLSYDWIETDILVGQSRTAEYLAMNPAGQVPAVILDDGRPLAQSNAIILHLAEGSPLIEHLWDQGVPEHFDFTTLGATEDVVVPQQ